MTRLCVNLFHPERRGGGEERKKKKKEPTLNQLGILCFLDERETRWKISGLEEASTLQRVSNNGRITGYE